MASANDPGRNQSESATQPGRNGGSRSGRQPQTPESGQESRSGGVQMRESGRARSVTGSRRQDLPGNPFEMMWDLSRQMDRMMSSIFRGFGSDLFGSSSPSLSYRGSDESTSTPTLWSPRIDVEQRGDALLVRADLPGVRKEDVTIDLSEEGLAIAGERREEREEGSQEQGFRSIERSYGRFYRMVPLPKGVKTEELKAQMTDGVLQITIPLDESARPRRIQIQG